MTVGFLKGKKKKIGIYQGFEVWFKQDRASLVAQLVKNPPAMWETWVLSLDWEDGEEKGYPLKYSSMEDSMDSIVHRVAKSQT